jgi:hypothetical protein
MPICRLFRFEPAAEWTETSRRSTAEFRRSKVHAEMVALKRGSHSFEDGKRKPCEAA